MDYWKIALSNAWSDTWDIVVNAPMGTVVVLGIIALAVVFFKHKTGEEHLKKGLTDLLLTGGITVTIFFVIFIFHVLFVTPSQLYSKSQSENGDTNALLSIARTTISNLETTNRALTEKLSGGERASAEAAQKKVGDEMKENQRRTEKMLLDIASSADPKQAALKALAEPRPIPSGLLSGGKIDLDAARASLANKETEGDASRALSNIAVSEFNSKAMFFADFALTNFISAFQDIAAKHGDTAISGYKGPPDVTNDTVELDLRMAKNTNCNFRIIFRFKENAYRRLDVWALLPDGSHRIELMGTFFPHNHSVICTLNGIGKQSMREVIPMRDGAQKFTDLLALLLVKQIELEPLMQFNARK